MAVSIWEGNKAQELIDAIKQTNKVDKLQGAANAGKALIVGPDGLVVPDNVLTNRMIMAFAEIFRHVVYTDNDSAKYYNELIASLVSSGKLVSMITAVYNPDGHTIYQNADINTLRNYLTVTANYTDGTAQTVTDYVLSGELDSASSVITISYLLRTTTVTVPVIIDSSLIYHIGNRTLDGQTSIDTNILLCDTNKAFTIIGDFTDTSTDLTQRHMVNCKKTVNGTVVGCVAYKASTNSLKTYAANASGSLSTSVVNQSVDTHRIKFAIAHPANSRLWYFTVYVDEQYSVEYQEREGYEFVSSDQSVIIGASPTSDLYWIGSVNMCNIYNTQKTLTEIKDILGVG